MDKIKLEQEIRNYENGDFDRDDLISLIINFAQQLTIWFAYRLSQIRRARAEV
jgi:hypothetical protein